MAFKLCVYSDGFTGTFALPPTMSRLNNVLLPKHINYTKSNQLRKPLIHIAHARVMPT